MTDQQQQTPDQGGTPAAPGDPQLGDGGDLKQEHVNELLERLAAAEQRAEAAEKAAGEATGKTPRYSAYDTTYEKFVGGVHAARKDAEKAAKDAGVKKFKIREV